MQPQNIRGDILQCIASKGLTRTNIDTKMLTALSLPPSPCHQKILMCSHILEVVPTALAVSLWSSQHYPSLSKSFKAFISSAVFCLKVVH